MTKNGFWRWVSIAGTLLAVSACAPTSAQYWQHPERPIEQWSADVRACQSFANLEAERRFTRNALSSIDAGRSESFESQLDALEARRERSQLLESCLTAQGYRRVP